MAEYSFPWEVVVAGDREVAAATERRVIADYGFIGVVGGLVPTKNGTGSVDIAAGSAIVKDARYANTATLNLVPPAGTRKDFVVVRYTAADRAIVAAVLQGTSGAFPALTQTAAVYEIAIASIDNSGGAFVVTDTRTVPNLCVMPRKHDIGEPFMFAGTVAPSMSMFCDGAAVSRVTYAALFAVIGTAFGAGDGSTTFNVPDMRDRVPVGASATIALGATLGEKTHVLTPEEGPAHVHPMNASTGYAAGGNSYVKGAFSEAGVATGSAGGGQPHNNMQPSVGVNYCIQY